MAMPLAQALRSRDSGKVHQSAPQEFLEKVSDLRRAGRVLTLRQGQRCHGKGPDIFGNLRSDLSDVQRMEAIQLHGEGDREQSLLSFTEKA